MVSEFHDFGLLFFGLAVGFWPNPVDLYGWVGQEADWLFAQDAFASGHFAQQWELRMMALGAARKELANSKLRCLQA